MDKKMTTTQTTLFPEIENFDIPANANRELSASIISYKERINTPLEKLWKIISAPKNLNFCHPYCKKNTVVKWCGKGSIDSIEYYNGLVLNRIFTKWDQGKGYELLIGNGKYATAKVLWVITDTKDGSSNLSITIDAYTDIALKKYPKFLRVIIRELYFLPNMSKYLQAVVKGFKFYSETGIPVKKNQFGHNSMFSTHDKDSTYNEL